MIARIQKGLPQGQIPAPPSKSYTQRYLLAAALAQGKSVIRGVADSEDIRAALDCIRALGASYKRQGNNLVITGKTGAFSEKEGKEPFVSFPCRESGNTLRFFIPVSMTYFPVSVFYGSKRLMERGISVYEELFRDRNVTIRYLDGEKPGVRIEGMLKPGPYTLRGDISSQFVTGLLYALPLLDGDSTLTVLPPVESRTYIDMTLALLADFGIRIEEPERDHFLIRGGQRYQAGEYTVEGDWSNAAFLHAFKALGADLSITGLSEESLQGDRVCVNYFRQLDEPDPLLDISGCPDLGPVLFVIAALKHGAKITGTRRLRIKESDRAAVMKEELLKCNVPMTVLENEVLIPDVAVGKPKEPFSGHNDHRIVMALTVLSCVTGGEIKGCEAVNKTWPLFFEEMRRLKLSLEIEDDTE
ncbi:MAG: 3-phosphoshikimate 1-carboxyvinyltransferase [Lachnospiraceae bacterium]|nr:3-phosphoshikimate 1-carboxyvinyltransferase [Lachnospiraceae bacterium]